MTEAFAILYDLRDPGVWDLARYHRRLWGRLYTDLYLMGLDHIVLVFRPAGERRRLRELALRLVDEEDRGEGLSNDAL